MKEAIGQARKRERERLGFCRGKETPREWVAQRVFYMWAYRLRDKRAFGFKTVGFSHLSKWVEAHFTSKVGIGLVARLLK